MERLSSYHEKIRLKRHANAIYLSTLMPLNGFQVRKMLRTMDRGIVTKWILYITSEVGAGSVIDAKPCRIRQCELYWIRSFASLSGHIASWPINRTAARNERAGLPIREDFTESSIVFFYIVSCAHMRYLSVFQSQVFHSNI